MLQSISSENNLVNCFGSNFHKKAVLIIWATPKMKTTFLAEITKTGHQLLEIFYSITITYALAELCRLFFYLEWHFLSIKCHSQLKQLMDSTTNAVASFTDLKHQQVFFLNFLHIIHTIIYNGKKKMFSQWNEILSK